MRQRTSLALAAFAWLLGFPLAAMAAPVPPEAAARAAQRGYARVIVELATPAPAASSSSVEDRVLRAAIGWHQDEIGRRVGIGPGHRPRQFGDVPLMAFDATPAMLARLANDPSVLSIQSDRLMRPSLVQTVVTAGADTPFAAGFDGAGIAVAILDTGVDASHAFFGGRVVAEACFSGGSDCPGGGTSQIGTGAGEDCSYSTSCFHGTHVAGIAAGWNATRHGVAPGADIVSVQIFSRFTGSQDCGTGPDPCPLSFTSDMIAGMNWVGSLTGVTVAAVNVSLGDGSFSSEGACHGQNSSTRNAVDGLVSKGINVAAAAGNDGNTNGIHSPACISSAMAVAGIDDQLSIFSGSNSNSLVDYFAPAVSVTSSVPGGSFATASGTSMATPHVAGAMAVLRSQLPNATAADIRTALNAGPAYTDTRNGVTRPRLDLEASVVSIAPGECFDGIDNDSDGDIDFAADVGCASGSAIEGPECDDGIDNDSDGFVDWDGGGLGSADPGCSLPTSASEATVVAPTCGVGPELALVLPLLAALRRRQRSRA